MRRYDKPSGASMLVATVPGTNGFQCAPPLPGASCAPLSFHIDSHLAGRTIETLSRPSRPHHRRSPTPNGLCRPRGSSALRPVPLSLSLSLFLSLSPPGGTTNFPKPSMNQRLLSAPRSGEIFPIVTRSALPGAPMKAYRAFSLPGPCTVALQDATQHSFGTSDIGRWHPIAVADLRRHFHLMGLTAVSDGF